MQILSRFHFSMKWGKLHMAKVQIESEIYMFRTQSGPYNPRRREKQEKEKQVKRKGNKVQEPQKEKAKPPSRMRDVFTKRVTDLYGSVLSNGMDSDALQVPTQQAHDTGNRQESSAAEALLKSPSPTYGTVGRDVESGVVGRIFEGGLLGSKKETDKHEQGERMNNHIGGEDYYHLRVLPLLAEYQEQAPKTSRKFLVYELLILTASLFSTLLAALSMNVWVPVTLAISGMLAGFLQHEALQGQLIALNAGIADLTLLTTKWASYGAVEKRTQSTKNFMVELTENCCLRTATAYVAGMAQADFVKVSEDDDEDQDESTKTKGKQSNTSKKTS